MQYQKDNIGLGQIKGSENLSEEQIKYLKKPSISFLMPLSLIFRKHWGLLVVFISFSFFRDFLHLASSARLFFVVFLFLYGFYVYWGVTNSRKLSWNRNKWASFDDFVKSEKKWKPWAIVSIILSVFFVLWSIFFHSFDLLLLQFLLWIHFNIFEIFTNDGGFLFF